MHNDSEIITNHERVIDVEKLRPSSLRVCGARDIKFAVLAVNEYLWSLLN